MIKTIPPLNINGETPDAPPPQGAGLKSPPKGKLGVFAKLLEGLLRTAKPGKAPAAEAEAPEDGPEGLFALAGFEGLAGLTDLETPESLENPAGFTGLEAPEVPPGLDGTKGKAGRAPGAGALLFPESAAPAEKAAGAVAPGPGREGLPEAVAPVEEAAVEGEGRAALAAGAPLSLPEEAGEAAGAVVSGAGLPPGTEGPVAAGGTEPEEGSRERKTGRLRRLPELPPGLGGASAPETSASARKAAARAEDGDRPAIRVDPRRNEGREKRRERLSLEVRDYRQGLSPQALPEGGPARGGPASSREVELRLDLPWEDSGGNSPESPDAPGAPAGRFESLLAGELREGLGEDILRQATLLLRDGGEGLIRLALKPESLGTVKIRLEMAENKVSGRIIVESDEVLRAFEREIQTLEQAFKDSGFDGASIEMAVDSGNGEERRGQRQGEPGEGFFLNRERRRQAAADYGSAQILEGVFDWNGSPGSSRRPVNMLV